MSHDFRNDLAHRLYSTIKIEISNIEQLSFCFLELVEQLGVAI